MSKDASNMTAAELKAALAAKEREETAATHEMAEAEKLKGKAYFWVSQQRQWVSWHAKRYTGFDRRHGGMHAFCQEVNAHWRSRPAPEAAFYRKDDRYGTLFHYAAELHYTSLGTLTDEQFEHVWAVPLVMAKSFIAQIGEQLPNLKLEPYGEDTDRLPEDEKDIPLDAPHLKLESNECSMLPRAFTMPGYRYLLTPASRALGMKYLRKEEADLQRGSHLYQECDMRYVTRQYETIRKLRGLLAGG